MALVQIIPEIYYHEISTALKFFVDGLGFSLVYEGDPLYIVKRDEITIMLSVDAAFADGDRPQLRIATDQIDEIYNEIKQRSPEVLHPNLNYVKDQDWGLREFAALDPTTVCIIFQQPVKKD